MRALADELASAADLAKGKLTSTPVAVVRGLAALVTDDDGPGAAALLRTADSDWFALGHVEAVRSALGVPPGGAEVPPRPMAPGDAEERLARAVAVAAVGRDTVGDLPPFTTELRALSPRSARLTVVPAGDTLRTGEALALGALAQRLLTAAWSEDLTVACSVDDRYRVTVVVEV